MISDKELEKMVGFASTLYHCWKCGLKGDDWQIFLDLKAEFLGAAVDTAFFKCPVCGNTESAVVNLKI